MRTMILMMTVVFALAMTSVIPAALAQLSADDKAAIRASVDAFAKAASAKNWNDIAALYAEDAVLLPPNMPAIIGRAAIKDHFAAFPPMKDFKLELVDVDGNGDLAYSWGKYSMTIVMEGAAPIKDKGKFMEVRRKQKDGSWLYIQDMYSSDLSAKH